MFRYVLKIWSLISLISLISIDILHRPFFWSWQHYVVFSASSMVQDVTWCDFAFGSRSRNASTEEWWRMCHSAPQSGSQLGSILFNFQQFSTEDSSFGFTEHNTGWTYKHLGVRWRLDSAQPKAKWGMEDYREAGISQGISHKTLRHAAPWNAVRRRERNGRHRRLQMPKVPKVPKVHRRHPWHTVTHGDTEIILSNRDDFSKYQISKINISNQNFNSNRKMKID